MKKNKSIDYQYIVSNISEDEIPAYKAYVPAFDAIIYGDDEHELKEGILFAIECGIKDRKKAGLPIPPPEKPSTFSGKFMLRIPPALHEKLSLTALALGKSLNSFIEEKLLRA